MTSKRGEQRDREDLLVKLLTEEIDPHGAEGCAILDRHPELHKELERIGTLASRLDDLASREVSVVAALSSELPPSPPVDRALKSLWEAEARGVRARRTRLLAYAGLAAAALILLLTLWPGADDRSDEIRTLGGTALFATSPSGMVQRYAFTWNDYPLPPGYTFKVYIDAGDGAVAVWSGTTAAWEPSPAERAALPDRIEWWVGLFAPGGRSPVHRSATVTLIRSR